MNVKTAPVSVKADASTRNVPSIATISACVVILMSSVAVAEATTVIVSNPDTVAPNTAPVVPLSAVKLMTSPELVPPTKESLVSMDSAAAATVKALADALALTLSLPVAKFTVSAFVKPAPTVTTSAAVPLPVTVVKPDAFAKAPKVKPIASPVSA